MVIIMSNPELKFDGRNPLVEMIENRIYYNINKGILQKIGTHEEDLKDDYIKLTKKYHIYNNREVVASVSRDIVENELDDLYDEIKDSLTIIIKEIDFNNIILERIAKRILMYVVKGVRDLSDIQDQFNNREDEGNDGNERND